MRVLRFSSAGSIADVEVAEGPRRPRPIGVWDVAHVLVGRPHHHHHHHPAGPVRPRAARLSRSARRAARPAPRACPQAGLSRALSRAVAVVGQAHHGHCLLGSLGPRKHEKAVCGAVVLTRPVSLPCGRGCGVRGCGAVGQAGQTPTGHGMARQPSAAAAAPRPASNRASSRASSKAPLLSVCEANTTGGVLNE